MISRIGRVLVAVTVACLALAGTLTWARDARHVSAPAQASAAAPATAARAEACAPACRYTGVALSSPAEFGQFGSATKVRPGIVEIYDRFGAPFPARWASAVAAADAIPMIRVNPRGVSPAAIAGGEFDGYLTAFGAALRRFGAPVAISLAPGANSNRVPWGCRTRPAAYQAAWRHIETVIGRAGAREAIWVWAINVTHGASCPGLSRYPGADYVDWVAVNGYLRTRRSTFGRVFGSTLRLLRRRTHKPVVIAETGVSAGPGQARKILGLYRAAAAAPDVIGVVYLAARTEQGDYRFQHSAAALAYRQATADFVRHSHRTRSAGGPHAARDGSG